MFRLVTIKIGWVYGFKVIVTNHLTMTIGLMSHRTHCRWII